MKIMKGIRSGIEILRSRRSLAVGAGMKKRPTRQNRRNAKKQQRAFIRRNIPYFVSLNFNSQAKHLKNSTYYKNSIILALIIFSIATLISSFSIAHIIGTVYIHNYKYLDPCHVSIFKAV